MRSFTLSILIVLFFCSSHLVNGQEYRSYDGYGNNLSHPEWGTAGINVLTGTIGYADGISAPAGPDRPNPRLISNLLFTQTTLANDTKGRSGYSWVWGQFVDHDITASPNTPSEILAIPIPAYDMYFDPSGTGTVTIPMPRSDYDPLTGTDINNPRRHYNNITSFIDASGVYGSSVSRANWLRTFSGGKLKSSTGNLLPWNTIDGEYASAVDPSTPFMDMPLPHTKFFVAGDFRANENPFLCSIHTTFMREHNRLCDELAQQNPTWDDEQLYQQARKLVGGLIQAIVYEEWLPMLGLELPAYSWYNPNVNPTLTNSFNTAAFRYGHTAINSLLVRMDNDGNYIPQGDILLRDAFFNPTAITSIGAIEPYLIGMSTVVAQDFDCKVVDDLRNFLFGQPGAGGMDLVALNIQRGRDRGLPDYNTVRIDHGLPSVSDFTEISSDPLLTQILEFLYGDVNKMDPWVGMLVEDQMSNMLFGRTALTIIGQQFQALRDGDRFYYLNDSDLTSDEKDWIKQTRLADVIKRNTPITIIQDDVFTASPLTKVHDVSRANVSEMVIYPNPVVHQFAIRIESFLSEDATLKISNIAGETIMERSCQLDPGNNILSLSMPFDAPSGTYLATLVSNRGNLATTQFVKQ